MRFICIYDVTRGYTGGPARLIAPNWGSAGRGTDARNFPRFSVTPSQEISCNPVIFLLSSRARAHMRDTSYPSPVRLPACARARGRRGKSTEGNEFYAVVTKRDYTFARQLRTPDANDLSAGRFPFPFLFSSLSLSLSLRSVGARVHARARNQFTRRRDLRRDRPRSDLDLVRHTRDKFRHDPSAYDPPAEEGRVEKGKEAGGRADPRKSRLIDNQPGLRSDGRRWLIRTASDRTRIEDASLFPFLRAGTICICPLREKEGQLNC